MMQSYNSDVITTLLYKYTLYKEYTEYNIEAEHFVW
jgi:hypothetical protein